MPAPLSYKVARPWLVVVLLGLLAWGSAQKALATAHYVFHERSTNDVTGGGAGTSCAGAQPYVDVLTPSASQTTTLRFKIEFQLLTDQARVYYTTDGSNPVGSFGQGSNTTQVIAANYACTFTNGGNVIDVCTATVPALPAGTTVKYILGTWHSSGGDEIFANGGTCNGCSALTNASQAAVFQYTVGVPPAIVQPPASLKVRPGDTATFRVTAAGTAPLSYQWRHFGYEIIGATSASYTIFNVLTIQAGDYDVVVFNPYGSVTSAVATLTVLVPPTIVQQPASQTNLAGTTANYFVNVVGSEPLNYQWYFNRTNALNGATNAFLSLPDVQPANAGGYSVVVTNEAGGVTSAVATLTVVLPPTITAQPASLTVTQGSAATFSVGATSELPITYQWRLNGVEIPAATSSTYFISSAQEIDAGSYDVVVADANGAVISAPALLTVLVPPTILVPPASQTLSPGSMAIFYVVAYGSEPLLYQWRYNNGDLAGETNALLVLNNVQFSQAGNYAVRVRNAAGEVLSDAATLTVQAEPVITTQPQSRTNVVGDQVTFSVTAAGAAPLFYQWRFNGVDLSGETADTLILNNVQTHQTGGYSVVVTNNYGSATSAVAHLTVFAVDLGDAPSPYPTLLANNGARHWIVPGMHLGALVDGELDGQSSGFVNGDDVNGSDDEDGVTFPASVFIGHPATVTVVASTNGFLNAWVDLSRNNSWAEAGEQVFTNRALVPGTNLLSWVTPVSASAGPTATRFRFATSGDLSFTGLALDGEVEDYLVTVLSAADLNIAITDSPDPVTFRSNVTYTISVTNQGPSSATGVQVVGPLPSVFSFVSATASQGSCANQSGTVVCSLGTLANGARATITIVATANRAGFFTNTVSVAANEGDPLPASNLASQVTAVTVRMPTYRSAGYIELEEIVGREAIPYPSTLNVSGLTAAVYKVTVTLSNLSHTYPDDIDVLLVGPGGQSVVVMSDAGGDVPITNVSLTLDDAETQLLPNIDEIIAGTYHPTDLGPTIGSLADTFPSPAPPRPWGANLAVFNGANPNGAWSLYVYDDLPENGGAISNGWALNITTADPMANLGIVMSDQPDPVAVGSNLIYTITVTNRGPAVAAGVTVADPLPGGVAFVSASPSTGSCSNAAGTVICSLGNLSVNGSAAVTLTVRPTVGETMTNIATVYGYGADLDLSNNTVTNTTTCLELPAIVTPPQDVTVIQGQTATFSVAASGTALRYQWQFNNADLPGQTNTILTISNAQPADAGSYTVRVTNVLAFVVSSPATLTVLVPPAITAQPQSRTNFAGSTATFTVELTGTLPFSYQWYFNGTNLLVEATNATLVLTNVHKANAGGYHVAVHNAAGSVTSDEASLTVWEADFGDAPAPFPTLLASDGARHILVPGIHLGASVDFEPDGQPNATATGDEANGADENGVIFTSVLQASQTASVEVVASTNGFLDAWMDFDGNGSWAEAHEHFFSSQALVAGTNWLSFQLPGHARDGQRMARFRFSGAGGLSYTGLAPDGEVEDYAVTISPVIDLAVQVQAQPDPAAVDSNLIYTVTVTNLGPSDASEVGLTNWLPETVSFSSVAASQGSCTNDQGIIYCLLGSLAASSNAVVTITVVPSVVAILTNHVTVSAPGTEFILTNNSATTTILALEYPAITTQPQSLTVTNGVDVTFSVTATGTEPLYYQWRRNGTDRIGATGPTLVLSNVQSADAGAYTVVVSNAAGSVTSSAANLTVLTPPYVLAQPRKKTVIIGANHTFSVTAGGDAPLFYQWNKDGVILPGQTNDTLALVNIQTNDAGGYQVVITNYLGSVTSVVALLVVRSPDDPVYPDPPGGWAYLYAGNGVAATSTAALDGTWNHDNGIDSWAGDGRGAGNGQIGGMSSTNGILAIEDALASGSGTDNRRIYLTHNLGQESGVTNAGTLLNDGVTLSFRARLTPPTDPRVELTNAPNGWINNSDGKGMFGLRQGGAGGMIISFSLNNAIEDAGPTTTTSLGAAGLHFNNLNGDTRSANVDPGEGGRVNLLSLDPTVFHEFWITIQDNGSASGTHLVSIYLDGSQIPATFNVTAGTGNDIASSDTTSTNYLALGLGSTGQRGAVDVDFLAYKPGVIAPFGFEDPVGITQQPVSQFIVEGEVASFNVGVTGTPPLRFQWHKSGTAISQATNASYTTPPATLADDGSVFTVVVTNDYGSVTSAPALLRLLLPPVITAQPQSLVVTNGDPASFNVTVASAGALTYQWRFYGTNLSGATSSNLVIAAVSPAHAGPYDVIAANAAGAVTSQVATLTVHLLDCGDAPVPYPTLMSSNGARHVLVPGIHLGATVDGEGNGQPEATAAGDDLNGDDEDGVTFVATPTVGQPALVDVVAATNGLLDAWLDFNGNGSWAEAGEQIFTNQSLVAGTNSLSYVVPLTASTPNSFGRFRFSTAGGLSFAGPAADGEVEDYAVPITLLTDLAVTLADSPDPVGTGSNLTYSVTVTNAGPSSASGVTLTDTLPGGVTFVFASTSQGGCVNDSGTVTCLLGQLSAGGSATVTLVVSPVTEGAISNRVVVASAETDPRPADNAAAVLTEALVPPSITAPPASLTVTQGQTAVFTVVAAGTTLSHQWRFNGVVLSIATNATLAISNAQPANAGAYVVVVSNRIGQTASGPASLTVLVPPAIVVHPASRTNYGGSVATFSVSATGTEPLAYQWFFNGTNALTDATNATLILSNVQTNQNGGYTARVINSAGAVTSAVALLTVLNHDFGDAPAPFPTLLANDGARHRLVPGRYLGATVDFEPDGRPESAAAGDDADNSDDEDGVTFPGPLLMGQPATARVVASTNGYLDAWIDFNGNGSWADANDRVFEARPLVGGTNLLSLTVPSNAVLGVSLARFRFSGVGHLSVTGEAPDGEVEDYALPINAAVDLALTQLALPSPVAVGSNLVYTITVTNQGPSGATGVRLIDTLPAGVVLNSVTASQGTCQNNISNLDCSLGALPAGSGLTVTVTVTPSALGMTTNQATASADQAELNPANNVATAIVEVMAYPTILAQPQSLAVTNGASAALSVTATGTRLNYQWRLNGTNVPGATAATLVISSAQLVHAGPYTVQVSNEVGAVVSDPAVLTVLLSPVILTQPQSRGATNGATVTFSVTATGTPPLSYQWYFNGAPVPGGNNPSLTLSGVNSAHEGIYTVTISNFLGSVASAPASLTVVVPPQITQQPQSRTNIAGTVATLSVTATGTEPLTYQWYFNGTITLPGATTATLVFTNAQRTNSGDYVVVVGNAGASVTSTPATLTVLEIDFGDAPDPSYPTLLASFGAHHTIVPGVHLGAAMDFETDGLPDATATGDDLRGVNDDDGVRLVTSLRLGQATALEVVASTNGYLDAWMDFNQSGRWDDDFRDHVIEQQALVAGTNQLSLVVPGNAALGSTFARFRFSTVGGLSFDGPAPDGEVEDYRVTIAPAMDLVVAQLVAHDLVLVGSRVTNLVAVTNLGPSAAPSVTLDEILPDGVRFVSAVATQGSCANQSGTIHCDLGTFNSGGGAVVTIIADLPTVGILTRTVSVTANEFDANLANNTATQTTLVVAVSAPFRNASAISVPDAAPGAPYPSTLLVSGLTAAVYQVTVTLSNIYHTYSDDLDILLVGPQGQTVVLMSDAGGETFIEYETLTFDDEARLPLTEGLIVSGTFKPTNYEGLDDPFPPPAPPGPFGTALSVFRGTDPNGLWSLYVVDDSPGDAGNIQRGWSLTFVMLEPIADVAVARINATEPAVWGSPFTYTIQVTNHGPAAASGVRLTNVLPASVNLISANASQGSCTSQGGVVHCALGTLSKGSSAVVTLTVIPTAVGTITHSAQVSANVLDFVPANNAAAKATTVVPALSIALAGNDVVISWPDPSPGYALEQTARLEPGHSWTPVTNAPVVGNGRITVTLPRTGAMGWYRLKWQ